MTSTAGEVEANPLQFYVIIHDQLNKGIVERVEDMDEKPDIFHHLPHRAVIQQDKEAIKIVSCLIYDAPDPH